MEREMRRFQGWHNEVTPTPITRDTVISTEGQVPPEPEFHAPELFTDLTGVEYKLGGKMHKAYRRDYVSYFYYVPEETPSNGKLTRRIFPESYVKNVLDIQAKQAERERRNHAGA